ncbi:MAG TPA: hypothetical protein VK211_29145 [Kamptonema sp.]|nr:hypothetical protein [Kamptonema sp.]
MKKLAIALLTLAAAAIALPQEGAIAEVMKALDSSGKTRIIITGLTPEASVSNLLLDTDWKTSYGSVWSACGIASFTVSPTTTQFHFGQRFQIGSTVSAAPTCASLGHNQNVRVGNTVYFRYVAASGETSKSQFIIPKPRTRKANKCGFLSFVAPPTLSTFEYSGQEYNFRQMNLVQAPICRKIGNSYITYVKQ